MTHQESYTVKEFDLSGLNGISDETLEMHFGLYEGYVENTNRLRGRLAGMKPDSKDPAWAEMKRRLGFEYNGMILHEYYFGNMKKGGGGDPQEGSEFVSGVEANFGDFESWKADFIATGGMRGIGWAICYLDAATGWISNHWINEHQDYHVAGFSPILIMDVWEHAFLLDYKPSEKDAYMEAFLSNVDWDVVERRIELAE